MKYRLGDVTTTRGEAWTRCRYEVSALREEMEIAARSWENSKMTRTGRYELAVQAAATLRPLEEDVLTLTAISAPLQPLTLQLTIAAPSARVSRAVRAENTARLLEALGLENYAKRLVAVRFPTWAGGSPI